MVMQAFWSGRRKTLCDWLLRLVVVSPLLLTAARWGGRGLVRAEDPLADNPRLAVQIESWFILEDVPLPLPAVAAGGQASGFRLGGLSDLHAAGGEEGALRFWALTDRGPNGVAVLPASGVEGAAGDRLAGKECRTLPVPEFSPTIVELEAAGGGGKRPGTLRARVCLPLTSRSGQPTSGRPTAIFPTAKPMVHPGSLQELPADPHGFDSEGLVRLSNGQFWVAEEYGPSLAEVSPTGCVLRRLVPRGTILAGADCAVEDVLPADYARRCDNRGLESLAVAPDQSRLFCLLQSPLEPAGMAPGEEPHSVRLLVLDPVAGRPVAEYLYPLGDRADSVAHTVAADGKISALAAIDGTTLLVLEQSDHHSRIYRVDLTQATNVLTSSQPAADGTASAAQRAPAIERQHVLEKECVADLAPLAARFHADILPGMGKRPKKLSDLKFEGMTLLDGQRVALVNDNDFDLNAAGTGPATPPNRRTCLWVLRLSEPVR